MPRAERKANLCCDACHEIFTRAQLISVFDSDKKYLGNLCLDCRHDGRRPKPTRTLRGRVPKLERMTLGVEKHGQPPAVDPTKNVLTEALRELKRQRDKIDKAVSAIESLLEGDSA